MSTIRIPQQHGPAMDNQARMPARRSLAPRWLRRRGGPGRGFRAGHRPPADPAPIAPDPAPLHPPGHTLRGERGRGLGAVTGPWDPRRLAGLPPRNTARNPSGQTLLVPESEGSQGGCARTRRCVRRCAGRCSTRYDGGIPPVASVAGCEARFGGSLRLRAVHQVAGRWKVPCASCRTEGNWQAGRTDSRSCLKKVGWRARLR